MNPELQRNLWLEAAPRRLAWAGLVLVLIYGTALLVAAEGSGTTKLAPLWIAGTGVFVVAGLFWGARAAGFSVLSEIGDRTWDFQRLSALTAWQMTWGKLVGAPALASLCGLSGLLAILLSGPIPDGPNLVLAVATAAAFAVLLQASSLGAALIGVRKARAEGRLAQARGVLFGFFVGAFMLGTQLIPRSWRGLTNEPARDLQDWWGLAIGADVLSLLTIAVFAGWAIVGAWRLMRLELQQENSPFVWIVFLLFSAFWVAGYGANTQSAWSGAVSVLVGGAYAAAFTDPADKVKVRQFLAALRDRTARLMLAIPAAVPAIALAMLGAVGALAFAGEAGPRAVALVAFMLRDIGLIAFFRFGPRPRRGDFAAAVALALAYGVGGSIGGVVGGDAGAALFHPLADNPMASIISALAQAALVWTFAIRRIRRSGD